MSIRQNIITAIDGRLKIITTANSYKTNIGQHVFDWLDRDLADSELDALIYRDKSNEISDTGFGAVMNTVTVEIEVKTKSSSTTAAQVRKMIEDVYKAIGTDDTWGGLALSTIPEADVIELSQAEKIAGSAIIIVKIQYYTNNWQY